MCVVGVSASHPDQMNRLTSRARGAYIFVNPWDVGVLAVAADLWVCGRRGESRACMQGRNGRCGLMGQ